MCVPGVGEAVPPAKNTDIGVTTEPEMMFTVTVGVVALPVMIVPVALRLIVNVPGMDPDSGATVNAGGLAADCTTVTVKLPEPVRLIVPDCPQPSVSAVGEAVKVVVATASPLSPCTPSSSEVSTVRPVESVTMNRTEPQPVNCAVKRPPLLLTMLGLTDAKLGKGEETV